MVYNLMALHFKNWLTESWFEESGYKINGQMYSVPKLAQYASKNLKLTQLPVDEIKRKYVWAENLFVDVGDEEEWAVRSMKADLKFPVLMLRYQDGSMELIDGNHRTWKAWRTGVPAIPAYIFDIDSMPQPNEI